MIAIDNLTPTERRMLTVLIDNNHHTKQELIACLGDEESNCLGMHLHNLRKKLQVSGHTVATIWIGKRTSYQLVRMMASPYDGRS